jgi:hypothetical protein
MLYPLSNTTFNETNQQLLRKRTSTDCTAVSLCFSSTMRGNAEAFTVTVFKFAAALLVTSSCFDFFVNEPSEHFPFASTLARDDDF